MPTIRTNEIEFKKGRNIEVINFKWDNQYIVTNGQPWSGVKSSGGKITVEAGRKGSEECAQWLTGYCGDANIHMIHTLGGSNIPDKLNFAFKGTLSVDGHNFSVCIGQGHNVSGNNWHIISQDIEADADSKNGELGKGIRISQDGSHSFELSTIHR